MAGGAFVCSGELLAGVGGEVRVGVCAKGLGVTRGRA